MHVTTGRRRLGLLLSLTTAFLWGLLPIALKALLDGMDPYTITWYRFLTAACVLFFVVRHGGNLPTRDSFRKNVPLLMLVCIVGLCGNYIIYLLGLDHLSPSTAQVVIQTAPVFFLFGGLIFFRERFNRKQWTGFGILVTGLLLFFNERLDDLLQGFGEYTMGVLLVVLSAVAWAAYALAQKQLLKAYPSETIMLVIYASGAILFLPLAAPGTLLDLGTDHLLLLAFCAFNTLVAYGCFAEALDHLEASRVSAVLAITPLITVIFMEIFDATIPDFENTEPLNLLGLCGALLVVGGSILTALGRGRAGVPATGKE